MEQFPLISVIVPVYNVEKYLDRCIKSIAGQSYPKIEIILVDDGSPDSCPAMCDNWAKKDSRIQVIHKPNGGLSDARNAGMSVATGRYIGFVDSDDWIEPDFYYTLFNALKEQNCDAVGCRYRKCSEKKECADARTDFSIRVYDKINAMSALIDNKIEQVVWNKLYCRAVVDGVPFEQGKYHEDEFWSYQVFAKMEKYIETDYVGYDYFQRADSIMGEHYSLKRLDAVEAKCRRQTYLETNMPELASKGRINLMFTCLYHGQLGLLHLRGKERRQALHRLKSIARNCKFTEYDYHNIKQTHKVWMNLSKISFTFTCILRNMLRIGI